MNDEIEIVTDEQRQNDADRAQALAWIKNELIAMVWGNMSAAERKIVIGLPLTNEELDAIVVEWQATL